LMPKNMSQQMKSNPAIQQQEYTITGTVSDSNGMLLPGAAVQVNSQVNGVGVFTDIDGKFSIIVSSNEAIVIYVSFFGMEDKTVIWDGTSEVHVVLKSSEEMLEEVYVTGYQKIATERATGAFANIKTDELENFYSPDVTNLLEGKVAGVVLDNEGQIVIRGLSTFGATKKPLIVIDGLPAEGKWNDANYSALDDINPNDIASITVLKDAAASSIYGARAANGVIVVTTKRAKVGKTEIDFSTNISIRPKNTNGHLNLLSVSDYIDYEQNFLESDPEFIADPVAYFNVRDGENKAYSPVSYEYRQWALGNISESEARANIAAASAVQNI